MLHIEIRLSELKAELCLKVIPLDSQLLNSLCNEKSVNVAFDLVFSQSGFSREKKLCPFSIIFFNHSTTGFLSLSKVPLEYNEMGILVFFGYISYFSATEPCCNFMLVFLTFTFFKKKMHFYAFCVKVWLHYFGGKPVYIK